VIIHSRFINENKLMSIILCHDNLPCSTKMLVPFHRLLGNSFVSDRGAIESVGERSDQDFDILHHAKLVLDFVQKKSWSCL
jgi:hypothetical protein